MAPVTRIPCLHLRNIFDCPRCGHLLLSLKILFHLPDENSVLSWASALPTWEEKCSQVRDSFQMVSGPTFKLEKQKKFFVSEEQLLLPPPWWPSRVGWYKQRRELGAFQTFKDSFMCSVLRRWGHQHDFGQICLGYRRRQKRLRPHFHSTCFADGDKGLQYGVFFAL